jgi:dihydrofolate synthase/folylpolyglutamate synthase
MSYTAAMERLYALGHELAPPTTAPTDAAESVPHMRRKFDLEQMRRLMAALDHPEMQFRSVLIAGTNGKGSTAATLASILRTSGYRTGLYTSPHLVRVNERIQINGTEIRDDDFARLYFRVDEAGTQLLQQGVLPQPPSFFETITALAFLYFAEAGLDIAVLEVGLGGRLDATNIVEPMLSVITDISLDHTEWLGSTLTEIAREKAGILRRNGVLVTLPQHPEVNQALGEVAVSLGVTGINAADYLPQQTQNSAEPDAAYTISVLGEQARLHLPLPGRHQQRNTALAIAAAVELHQRAEYKKISAATITAGVAATRWPARLERFALGAGRADVLLDVAHNPAGAWTLRSALSQEALPGPRTLVFGCMMDKAYVEIAQILFPIFDRVVVTALASPRSSPVEALLTAARNVGVPATSAEDAVQAVEEALRQTPPTGLVVCAGSIYLAGPVRRWLLQQSGTRVEPGK